MIKPVLKIEVSNSVSDHHFAVVNDNLSKQTSLNEEYHIIVVRGTGEFTHIEIITASDIKLHQETAQ